MAEHTQEPTWTITDIPESAAEAGATPVDVDLSFVPDNLGSRQAASVAYHAGDFAKWIRIYGSETSTSIPSGATRISRSCEYSIGLVALAEHVGLEVFIGLVTSYLAYKMRGALRDEEATVEFEVMYSSRKSKKKRRLRYKGSENGLAKLLEKIRDMGFE